MTVKKTVGKPAKTKAQMEKEKAEKEAVDNKTAVDNVEMADVMSAIQELAIFTKTNIERLDNDMLTQGDAIDPMKMSDMGIEKITEDVLADKSVVEREAFMSEMVTITVRPGQHDYDLPSIAPSVNGHKVMIIRGVPTKVKRFVLEALARTRNTSYKQDPLNMRNPLDMPIKPSTQFEYQIDVHDDTDRGRKWLQSIYMEKN